MKTPEEIKKGLDHCGEDGCKDCPYVQDCTMMDGFSELAKDSLAYIKQLEEGIEQWEYVAASPGAVEDMARENAQMEAEIDRQREKIRVLELSLQAVNDGNATLQRENLMLEAQVPRWISVEERLPEYYTDVAVVVRNGDASWYTVAYLAVGGIWALEGGRRIIGVVTHWMPLPAAPKEE